MLNRGQGRGLKARHQGALRDAGSADASGYRGGNGRVADIDAGRLARRFRLPDGRIRCGNRGPVTLDLGLSGLQCGKGHLVFGDGLVALTGGNGLFVEGLFESFAVDLGEFKGGALPRDARETRLK